MPFRSTWDSTLRFEVVIAATVFAVVVLVSAWALVRYRARPGRDASQHTEHTRVELAYAIALAAVAVAIVVVTRSANASDGLDAQGKGGPPGDPPVTVTATGFQWCWQFRYADPAAVSTGSCNGGTVSTEEIPTLELPVGVPIRLQVTSRDVIHSLWIPAFRYKLDGFPHHLNAVTFTIHQAGTWLGHCAEFCGDGHAFMLFRVKAVPASQFNAWAAQHGSATSA